MPSTTTDVTKIRLMTDEEREKLNALGTKEGWGGGVPKPAVIYWGARMINTYRYDSYTRKDVGETAGLVHDRQGGDCPNEGDDRKMWDLVINKTILPFIREHGAMLKHQNGKLWVKYWHGWLGEVTLVLRQSYGYLYASAWASKGMPDA